MKNIFILQKSSNSHLAPGFYNFGVLEEGGNAWVALDGHFSVCKLFTAGLLAFVYLVACFRLSMLRFFVWDYFVLSSVWFSGLVCTVYLN